MRIAGVVVAFAGVLWYAWFSQISLQPKPKAPVADGKTSTQASSKPSSRNLRLALDPGA